MNPTWAGCGPTSTRASRTGPWSPSPTTRAPMPHGSSGPELAAVLPGVRYLRLDQKGRGRALAAAWSRSRAGVVAYMDVDLSTGLDALLPLVAPLVSGDCDLAIGSRLAPGSQVRRGVKRELLSRAYNRLLRLALSVRFSDAQCGFKALRMDVARRLVPLVEDRSWFFDTELLVLAERAGLRVHEVPVEWIDDPDSRSSTSPPPSSRTSAGCGGCGGRGAPPAVSGAARRRPQRLLGSRAGPPGHVDSTLRTLTSLTEGEPKRDSLRTANDPIGPFGVLTASDGSAGRLTRGQPLATRHRSPGDAPLAAGYQTTPPSRRVGGGRHPPALARFRCVIESARIRTPDGTHPTASPDQVAGPRCGDRGLGFGGRGRRRGCAAGTDQPSVEAGGKPHRRTRGEPAVGDGRRLAADRPARGVHRDCAELSHRRGVRPPRIHRQHADGRGVRPRFVDRCEHPHGGAFQRQRPHLCHGGGLLGGRKLGAGRGRDRELTGDRPGLGGGLPTGNQSPDERRRQPELGGLRRFRRLLGGGQHRLAGRLRHHTRVAGVLLRRQRGDNRMSGVCGCGRRTPSGRAL